MAFEHSKDATKGWRHSKSHRFHWTSLPKLFRGGSLCLSNHESDVLRKYYGVAERLIRRQ